MQLRLNVGLVSGALIVLGIMASCGHFNNRPHLKQVKALNQVLDTVEIMLDLDTAYYKGRLDSAEARIKGFENVRPDSMSWELVQKLAGAAQLTRAFSKVVNNYPYMRSEMELRKQQLRDLKHDLVYDKIDTLRIKKALDEEARHVYLLKLYVQGFISNLHYQDSLYPQITADLERVTDSLNAMKLRELDNVSAHAADKD